MSSDQGTASLDHILDKYVGGAGKYQLLNSFLMAWVYYAGLYALFITVFAVYEPPHRCRIEHCEIENQTKVSSGIYQNEWLEFAIPPENKSQNFLSEKRSFDGCTMYKRLDVIDPKAQGYCFPDSFSDNETEPCQDFIYSNDYFEETLTTKLDLVCDSASLKSLLDTLLIVGLLFGSLIGGRLGDKFGRKKAMFLAIAIIVPVTIINGHMTSYYAYAIFHFITMMCLPVIWVNAYVYSTEVFIPKWRYAFIGFFEIPIGYYIYNLIAYLNTTWTGIHIWVGIVTALVLPLYFILPESARWLAQNKKEEAAMEVLLRIAKINGKKLEPEDETKMLEIVKAVANESHKTEDKLTPLDMFRQGHAVKSLILVFAWITSCISFYALSLNSNDLSGDIMLNFFFSRTSGFGVAIGILLIANFFGRTKSLVTSHTLLGISCIGLAFIPKDNVNAVLIVYVFANIVASISKYNLLFLVVKYKIVPGASFIVH